MNWGLSNALILCVALVAPRAWAQDAGVGQRDAPDAGAEKGGADAADEKPDEQSEPPRILRTVDPEFPLSERGKGLHPNVVLRVTIDAHGGVSDAEVATSAGQAFDTAALAAVRKWSFAPALVGGNPVASRIRVAVHFEEPAPLSPAQTNLQDASGSASEGADATFSARAEAELAKLRGETRSASDVAVTREELEAAPRSEGAELLRSAPGVFVARTEGEGVAHRISLRGFDADHGQDLELRVEGIPINRPSHIHGQGYADLGFLISEVVEEMRVQEGVYDPAQGDFAVAGSIDFALGVRDRGWGLSSGYGAFGRFVQRLIWAPENERTQTFGAAQYSRTDGFGQNRAAESLSTILQANLGSGAWRFQPTLIASAARADLAGVLRNDDVEAGAVGYYQSYPFATAQQQNASSARFILGARAEYRGEQGQNAELGAWLGVDSFRLQENFTGFVQRSRLLEGVSGLGDLIEQEDSARSFGLRGRYRSPLYQHTSWLGARLELGVEGRFDDIEQSQNLIYAVRNETWDRRVDADIQAMNLGIWGDAEFQLTDVVKLRAGLRANLLSYVIDDRLGNFVPSTRDRDESIIGFRRSASGTAWGPRLSVTVEPIERLSLLLAYGQGFRSPQARTLEDGERAPFTKVHSADLGARYESDVLTASLSGFWTELSDDVAFEPREGRLERIGGTRRQGLALYVRTKPIEQLLVSTSLTYVAATLLEPPPPTAEEPQPAFEEGQALPYVPPLVWRLDLALHDELADIEGQALGGRIGLGTSVISERPLPHGQSADAFALVDVSARAEWWHFSLTFEVFNLFDAQYAANVYNFVSNWRPEAAPSRVPSQHFSAGAPRTWMLTLGVQL